MKKHLNRFFFILILAVFFVLFSCSDGGDVFGKKGKKFKGGNKVLRISYAFPAKNLDYRAITSITEANMAGLHLECLFSSDPVKFTAVPNLVENYSIDEKNKILKIELKKGIYFHPFGNDETLEELTAEDVKFSFDLLCYATEGNVQYAVIVKDRLAGAKEAYEESLKTGKIPDVKGVKVTGKYTVEFQLLNSPRFFMEILSYPGSSIISKKYFMATKRQIGTGPFIPAVDSLAPNAPVSFYKNVNYHKKDKKGNLLPYLDSVVNYFTANSEEAWQNFENGKLDILTYFPANKLKRVIEENISSFMSSPPKYIVQRNMGFMIDYLRLNMYRKPFNDLRVRKAIAMSINKDLLIEKALYGQAFGPANNGFVPPVFTDYYTDSVAGIPFNPQGAKKLLKEAGYNDGSELGELTMYVGNNIGMNSLVAAEIQRQLKEYLNINVTFESLEPYKKFLLESQRVGHIYKDAWVADYPNPESFLMCFYSALIPSDTMAFSYPNFNRYINPKFDEYYEKGRDASDTKLSMHYFKKADEILIQDVAAIPLWYNNDYILLKNSLKNLRLSPLKIYNFSEIDKVEK
jgi:ABC-type transport system substrate-binding protein